MRAFGLALVAAAVAACHNTSSGGGSVGPSNDGGMDAGYPSGGGGSDGGGSGGGSDAGSGGGSGSGGGGGGGGGGSDGGTASDCDGLAPSSIGAMQAWSTIFDGINGECGLAIASGHGVMAQMKTDMAAHPKWFLIDAATGSDLGTYGVWHGDLWPVPASMSKDIDFFSYVDEGAMNFHFAAVSSTGAASASTPSFHLYADEHAQAGDPNGGELVAGAIQLPDGRPNRRRYMSQQPMIGPRDLPRDAPVFGLDEDLKFRVLIIQPGDCSGCIAGQWFDETHNAAGDSFTLFTGFTPGPNTWFETAPLIGGGLAVRRVDAGPSGQYPYHSTWLVTVDSLSTSPKPAPDWLASRPDTNIALARNGTAYAVLPDGTAGGACTQRLELVSPSGNSCAHWDLDIASGSCTTSELHLGMDGTILQHTPTELERNPGGRPQSCTLRYWPAALR